MSIYCEKQYNYIGGYCVLSIRFPKTNKMLIFLRSWTFSRGGGGKNVEIEYGHDSATSPINAAHDFASPPMGNCTTPSPTPPHPTPSYYRK